MRQTVLKSLFGLILLGCFAACEQENKVIVLEPAERTVLVYMASDNSLSKFVEDDLLELKAGVAEYGLPSTSRLLVYEDMKSAARLIEIVEEQGVAVEKVVKTYPTRNSVGLTEMQEVFADVFENATYQAKSYGFVFWSHGEGWIPFPQPSTRWIGQDISTGDKRMNLSEFKQLLSTAPHFDFILFDACFMQSVELVYELRNYADYFVASPTETPADGAPYDAIFPYLFEEGASPALGEAYFNKYQEMYMDTSSDWSVGASISVLKASEMEQLAAATRQALQNLAEGFTPSCSELRYSVFNYDKRSLSSRIGYYDLKGMMEYLLLPSEFEEWEAVFDAAQVYWNTTPTNFSEALGGSFSMRDANGVSHYIPSSLTVAALTSYRSLAWYEDAGISLLWPESE